MVDFFNEVDEDLRADRLRTLYRRALPWAISLAVAAVVLTAGAWGWSAWRDAAAAKASDAYQKGLTAIRNDDRAAADAAFADVVKTGSPAYKALALMHRANVALADKKDDQAVKFLDEAAKAAPDPVLGDAARLKAAFLLMDKAPIKTLEERLTPLTGKDSPYRPVAREALALSQLRAGKTKQARETFQALTLDLSTPQDVAARAEAAKQLIDTGQAGQLDALVKAALALPPPKTLAANPFAQGTIVAPPAGAQAQ